MKEKTIIIVGGGQAAAMAAASLRQQGFTGELHLFSDEQHLPYERPPLSKSMLLEDSPTVAVCVTRSLVAGKQCSSAFRCNHQNIGPRHTRVSVS